MRQGRALLLGLLAGLLAGCASGKPVRSTSWLERWRPFHGPMGADVIHMVVALIERPLDDPFLNQELWTLIDEQAVALERKGVLNENGFRIGQIGGMTPAGLQTLLTSERSCVNPRRLLLHADKPTSLVLGPIAPICRFQNQEDGEPALVCLEQAQYTFRVVPSVTKDGSTRLQFTPVIRHGEKSLTPQPAPDGSGFVLQEEQPTKTCSTLAWEVTLAPNQYLVVGACVDRTDTLGSQYFRRRDETVPVQRLLVIRTCRASAELPPETDDDVVENVPSQPRIPLIALQAAWTDIHASKP